MRRVVEAQRPLRRNQARMLPRTARTIAGSHVSDRRRRAQTSQRGHQDRVADEREARRRAVGDEHPHQGSHDLRY